MWGFFSDYCEFRFILEKTFYRKDKRTVRVISKWNIGDVSNIVVRFCGFGMTLWEAFGDSPEELEVTDLLNLYFAE